MGFGATISGTVGAIILGYRLSLALFSFVLQVFWGIKYYNEDLRPLWSC